MKKLIGFLACLTMSGIANAGLIQWNGFGTSTSGWTIEAVVQIEQHNVVDDVNILDTFSYWKVNWYNEDYNHTLEGNGSSDLASGLTPDNTGQEFNFIVNNNEVISSFLCAWECNNTFDDRLDFGILTLVDNTNYIGIFDADITQDNCCIMSQGGVTSFSWSSAQNVSAPSMFSLMLACSLVLVIRAKNKKHRVIN